jgi:signal transduction histidine kinase
VLINLLLNALQAVADDERDDVENLVTVTMNREGDAIACRVSDSGPGIKPSQRENLFEPFFTTKTKGSGLGLYLSKRIVDKHGGRIEVLGDDAKMTTFVVTLPIGEEE